MTEPGHYAGSPEDASGPDVTPWPHWSSGLHQSLASHQASAAELRQELDDLRGRLDDLRRRVDAAPTRGQHRAPRIGRGPVVLGAVLVLAVGSVIARVALPDGGRPDSALAGSRVPTTGQLPTGASSAPASASGSRTSSAGTGVSAAPLPAWPGGSGPAPPGLPAHGVGADTAGTEVTARLADDRRTADVYERAVLSGAATTFSLRPAGTTRVARSLGVSMPAVTDLHAEIDGNAVPVLRTASGWTVTAPAPRGPAPRRLVLRYRLDGALVRAQPGPPGRYTLILTPIAPSAGGGAAQAVVVRIADPRVNEIYCPEAANQLCGSENGPLHIGTVPAGSVPLVVALVTFPG